MTDTPPHTLDPHINIYSSPLHQPLHTLRNPHTSTIPSKSTFLTHPSFTPYYFKTKERVGQEEGQGVRRGMLLIISSSSVANTSDPPTIANPLLHIHSQPLILLLPIHNPPLPFQSTQCGIKGVCLDDAGSRRQVHTYSWNRDH